MGSIAMSGIYIHYFNFFENEIWLTVGQPFSITLRYFICIHTTLVHLSS